MESEQPASATPDRRGLKAILALGRNREPSARGNKPEEDRAAVERPRRRPTYVAGSIPSRGFTSERLSDRIGERVLAWFLHRFLPSVIGLIIHQRDKRDVRHRFES